MRRASFVVIFIGLIACPGCGIFFGLFGDLDSQLQSLLNANQVTALTKPTTDPAKAELGRMLFFDKLLSGNENISCATCHHPAAFTGDGISLSIGQGGAGLAQSRIAPLDGSNNPIFIPRNAPDLFNRGAFMTMFWDMRVMDNGDGTFTSPAAGALLPGLDNALAVQACFPVTSRDEMRGKIGENTIAALADSDFAGIWSGLMARLLGLNNYKALFAAAYPGVAEADLTFAHAANAIAAFEIEHYTLLDSPFDMYLAGDMTAMSDAAKRGGILFYGSARCADCHSGTLMTNEIAYNQIIPQLGPGKGDGPAGEHDSGRARETGDTADDYKFRVPPLRNVAATGPWMHDGAYTTLEAAVRHMPDPGASATAYDPTQLTQAMEDLHHPEQMLEIQSAASAPTADPITLTDAEFDDLMAFLHSLTSPSLGKLATNDIPESVPSGLPLAD